MQPENVLLDESGHVRLTDFGLSKVLLGPDDTAHTFCGTPEYLAPEVINGYPHDKAVDWWAVGILLWEMLTGLPPFYHPNVQSMYELIRAAQIVWPVDAEGRHLLSGPARSLLQGLLAQDPRARLGCIMPGTPEAAVGLAHVGGMDCLLDGVEQVKSHPFFSSIDWNALYQRRVPPPWKPLEVGSADVSHFDAEFVNEPVHDSAPSAGKPSAMTKQASKESGAAGDMTLGGTKGQSSKSGQMTGIVSAATPAPGHAPHAIDTPPSSHDDSSLRAADSALVSQFGTLHPKFEGFTYVDRAALGMTLGTDGGVLGHGHGSTLHTLGGMHHVGSRQQSGRFAPVQDTSTVGSPT